MLNRIALGLALAALLAGCGGGAGDAASPGAQALPYSALNTRLTRRVTPTAATFRAPIEAYRRHVRRQLGLMLVDVRALRASIKDGQLGAARRAWLAADARYETIGAAYGAFGALDAAINGLPGGLRGGVRSPQFTGLHRIELGLWGRRSTADARDAAERLAIDVARLRVRVPRVEIDSLDFGLRTHEVLEDSLHLQLAGRASPWSGTALDALAANIMGTRVVLAGLDRFARTVDAPRVQLAHRALDRLDRSLRGLLRRGRLPRWDALGIRDRERIAGFTAAAAERLAFIPGLVDPRPPRPAQRATAASVTR